MLHDTAMIPWLWMFGLGVGDLSFEVVEKAFEL